MKKIFYIFFWFYIIISESSFSQGNNKADTFIVNDTLNVTGTVSIKQDFNSKDFNEINNSGNEIRNYIPLVSEMNTWSVVSGGLGSFLKVCCVNTTHYKIHGDTLIDLKNYKKVWSTTDSLKQEWDLTGFMREDIIVKKVWYRNLFSEEVLIYDFDIKVGSSVTLYAPYLHQPYTYQVIEIDSIFIQNELRKVYRFNTEWKEEWIEGIGSKSALLTDRFTDLSISFSELLCFSDNSINYTNPKFRTCHKASFTPFFAVNSFDTAYVNQKYYFKIPITDVYDYDSVIFVDSLIYSVVEPRLPKGLTLNHQTGVISGIPEQTGNLRYGVYLKNHELITDYLFADLIVVQNIINTAPKIISVSDTIINQYDNYSFIITAEDNEQDSLFFFCKKKPDWLNFEIAAKKTLLLTGSPLNRSTGDSVIFIVSDGFLTDTIVYSIKINSLTGTFKLKEALISFKIAPNPVETVCKINSNSICYTLFITDINGKLMDIIKNPTEVNFTEYPPGMYVLKIISDNEIQTLKLIKD